MKHSKTKQRVGTAKWFLPVLLISTGALLVSAHTAFAQQAQPGQKTANTRAASAAKPAITPHFRYEPVTPRGRFNWFVDSTVGLRSLAGGLFASAFGTGLDRPKEYGPHWGGYADRYGMRLTGVSTGNAIEASVGALWGEDPRYFRVPEEPFKARVRNVINRTFTSYRRDGEIKPAYARFIAISGNNFLSNTWRVQSEANVHDAVLRTGMGFGARMLSNTFLEFWPDVTQRVFHRNSK